MTSSAVEWYVAKGQKKIGPVSTSRLLARVTAGKVPTAAKAWREGMDAWAPIAEISELRRRLEGDAGGESDVAGEAPDPEAPGSSAEGSSADALEDATPAVSGASQPVAPSRRDRGTRKKERLGGKRREGQRAEAAKGPERSAEVRVADAGTSAASERFQPRYRLERQDMWRAFAMGLEPRRVLLSFAALLLALAIPGLVSGVGRIAAMAHGLLAVPFVLVAVVLSYVLLTVAWGALSEHTRMQLEEAATPSVGAALGQALTRAPRFALPPFLLCLAWLVPLVVLGVFSLFLKVPYLGPVLSGLGWVVHLALSALTLFLLVAAALGLVFGPVVAAFEGTGVLGTLRGVLDVARRGPVRILLWSFVPRLVMVPFAALVLGTAALVAALPAGLAFVSVGGEVMVWLGQGATGPSPVRGLTVGIVPAAFWVGLLGVLCAAALASVENALASLLYAGSRPGNDDLCSRDAYLNERARGAREQA